MPWRTVACGGDLKPENQNGAEGWLRLEWLAASWSRGRCPAILPVPDGVSDTSPAPAVTIWHQHAGRRHLGKTEPAVLQAIHTTPACTGQARLRGLVPDALCFEEQQDLRRTHDGSYEDLNSRLHSPVSAWLGKIFWICGALSITRVTARGEGRSSRVLRSQHGLHARGWSARGNPACARWWAIAIRPPTPASIAPACCIVSRTSSRASTSTATRIAGLLRRARST